MVIVEIITSIMLVEVVGSAKDFIFFGAERVGKLEKLDELLSHCCVQRAGLKAAEGTAF